MRKKINQLASGQYDNRRPLIQTEPALVEAAFPCGHSFSGELQIQSTNGVSFRGLIYSDDERIELPQNAFAGLKTQIAYVIRGEAIQESTLLEGHFTLVTNGGEIALPYRFSASPLVVDGTRLPGTLPELEEMYRTQPERLLSLFESEAFINLPFFQDDSLRAFYLSLRKSSDRRMALEEFLVSCGAKKAVRLSVEKEPQSYIVRERDCEGEVIIHRKKDGYFILGLRSEAPFIRLPKTRWTSLELTEERIRLPFKILPERLHEGKNLGELIINTGREEIPISLTVIPERKPDPRAGKRSQLRRARMEAARIMVPLYAAREPAHHLKNRMMRALDSWEMLEEPDTGQVLLRAEICRQLRRREEEKTLLEKSRAVIQRNRTENVNQYLWFLYLEEEMEKGSRLSESFLRLLYRLKEEEAERPELLPLLMRSDSEWAEQPEKSFQKIREHFEKGSLPLLLRIEALLLIKKYPELIRRLDAFTRYLLYFGARFDCIDADLARRAAGLIAQQKEYHVTHERILRLFYERFPSRDMLESLLTVLLRRGEPFPAYLSLYEKGIREDIRLADLYEYYLSALPTDYEGDIPQMVQLYYTYNSPVRLQAREALYRYVARQYGPQTQMYHLYEKQIRNFALEQLLKGNVNPEAAYFYEKMFIPQVIDGKTAQILSELVYTMRMRLSNRSIERILVIYGELQQEYAYPVRDGQTCIPVFTNHCRLLFVDRDGVRYAQNVFKRSALMQAEPEQIEAIRRLSPDSLAFKLERCQKALREELEESDARQLVYDCQQWEELSEAYREKLISTLTQRSDLNDMENSQLLLSLKNSSSLDARSGAILAEKLLQRGEDEAVLEMVCRLGRKPFDSQLLLKLADRQIRNRNYAYDKTLFDLALSLYRSDMMSPITLTYLCRSYNGSTESMRQLLDRAQNGDALYYDLPERLLGQMLFTEDIGRIDWVVDMYLQGTKNPDRQLLHAYAVLMSEFYFCRNTPIAENVFTYLKTWAAGEKKAEQLPALCQLALTKQLSEKKKLNQEEKDLASRFVQNLYRQGLIFPYQQKLGRFFPLPAELADKSYLEYRGSENEPVSLEIRLLPKEAEAEFHSVDMPHVMGGIYVRGFLLFSDEELEYRILRSGELVREDRISGSGREGSGRFGRLNRVIRAAVEGQDGWQEEICRFGKEDVILKEYFQVL